MTDKLKIDKTLIDDFRLTNSPTNYKFFNDAEIENIVDSSYTHHYLIDNFEINKRILDFYHLCTRNLISSDEIDYYKNIGFHGTKERFVQPFSINILGAYHRTCDLVQKLNSIRANCPENISIDNIKITSFLELEPYLIDYRNGFKKGFNDFENDNITKYLTPFADKQDYVDKVFEYITKDILFKHSWQNPIGFTYEMSIKNDLSNIIKGFENGQKLGGFYKVWSIVFSNHKLFQKHFEDFHKKNNEPEQSEADNSDKAYMSYDWFIVGLSFATGEMNNLLKKYDYNLTEIAELHFKRPNLRPCITASKGTNRNAPKNLFNFRKKMMKIIDYCNINNIDVETSFLERLPSE
jgi:hypothetical protein